MARMSRDVSREGTPAAISARQGVGAAAYTRPETDAKRARRPLTRWLRVMAYAGVRQAHRRIDSLLVPELAVPGKVTAVDFRRTVVLIAIAAVAFFIPSLPIAGVPTESWLPFSVLAGVVAVWVASGFLMIPRGSFLTLVTPFTNGVAMAAIGIMFRPYFHALDLLVPLVVAGHAIVHGIGPGLLSVVAGTLVVTFAIHDPSTTTFSDVGYAFLYLLGSALLPWTAWRLAERRAHLLGVSKRESESERARLQAVLRSMDDAVILVEKSGKTVLSNAAYDGLVATLGGASGLIEPLDERGRRINRSRWPHNRAARGETFEMSFTLQPPDANRRWYEAKGAPVGRGLGFRGGVVVIRDITDRSLRTQQEAFVATASHELRTPIAALHGYVQLLDRRLDPETQPRESEYARVALGQARRVGVLLERLFDLARIQSGQLEVELEQVDLRDTVERACDVARQLSAKHQVHLTFPESPVVVEADGARLEQVLLNVLTNAIQHAPDSERVDLAVTVTDERARVAIRDYGAGIAPERLTRLMSRRKSKRDASSGYQGLGLGLVISRELMRAQRGSIQITSDPGTGTVATVELPLWRSTKTTRRGRT